MVNNGYGAPGEGGPDGGPGRGPRDGVGELGEGLGADELELRRMLQGAVGGLQPSEGALDHLRVAVPRRRARKRQALVGAAAAVVLLGTGVPAALHVAGSGGGADANAANAGHGRPVPGDTGGATAGEEAAGNPSGELGGGSGSTGAGSGKGGTAHPDKPQPPTTGTTDGQVTDGTADPATSGPANLPVCTADQLAATAGPVGRPTANGKVYGTFRVVNISSADCVVEAPVTLGLHANGAADSARIGVAPHTADGPATQLPAPSTAVASMALKPSAAYEVKFGWVPKDTCPTEGGGTDPEPSTSPTEPETTTGGGGSTGEETGGTATDTGSDTTTGTEPQLLKADGPTEADGSVTVTHTPTTGAPTAEATIPQACAGTLYHTGILPAE